MDNRVGIEVDAEKREEALEGHGVEVCDGAKWCGGPGFNKE